MSSISSDNGTGARGSPSHTVLRLGSPLDKIHLKPRCGFSGGWLNGAAGLSSYAEGRCNVPVTEVNKIRNVVLLSHSGAGKTSISEAFLFQTKAITRLGRVEDGNTSSDYEPEEVKRIASIQTSLIPCAWNGHKINFLDTPGYGDFVGEVVSAVRAAESAVLVVAAPSGVELGAERGWARCEEAGMPRIIYVNKMDRENADFSRCLAGAQPGA